jgi:hypothetical protein
VLPDHLPPAMATNNQQYHVVNRRYRGRCPLVNQSKPSLLFQAWPRLPCACTHKVEIEQLRRCATHKLAASHPTSTFPVAAVSMR